MSSIITYILLHLTVGGPWGQGVRLARLMNPDGLIKIIKIIILIRANPLSKMHHVSSAAFGNERNDKSEKDDRYDTGGEKSDRNDTGVITMREMSYWEQPLRETPPQPRAPAGREVGECLFGGLGQPGRMTCVRPTELGPNGP